MDFGIGSGAGAPAGAEPVIYCDGAGSEAFRPGLDLELSHWLPNRTPAAFRADTSTEIAVRFVASGPELGAYARVVNDHVDVDGILSLFALLEPGLVLHHREAVVGAAEMGDFWSFAAGGGQRLFQTLICRIQEGLARGDAARDLYEQGFEAARRCLAGDLPAGIRPGLDALAASVARVEGGAIERTLHHDRFVHYAIPRGLAEDRLGACLAVTPFNVPLSDDALLLPHARNRLDGQRIALVSVETAGGWHYDLHYPGYAWADTPERWRPPGLEESGTSNRHDLALPALSAAAADFQTEEAGGRQWQLAKALTPFSALEGRGFPVVLSCLEAGAPAPSRLPPSTVAPRLAAAFAGS